jgi:hypothetical protein
LARTVYAQAEEDSPSPAGESSEASEPKPAPEQQKAPKRRKLDGESGGVHIGAGSLRIKGHAIAQAEYTHQERIRIGATSGLEPYSDSLDFSVPRARITLKYQAPIEWIGAELEFDFADRRMKDGYVSAEGKSFELTVGQHKMPLSAIETESTWKLPLARRGVISDALEDSLQVGGRRPGVLFGWRGGGDLRPRLLLGAYQGSVVLDPVGRDASLIRSISLEAQSGVARAEARLGPARVGVFYEHRVGTPALARTDHYATVGTDLKLDWKGEATGIRLYADVIVGESYIRHQALAADGKPWFGSAQVLAAYRLGGMRSDELYVEPFVLGALLDPDHEVVEDFAYEIIGGVNVGYWDRARITLQVERHDAQRNFPTGYYQNKIYDRYDVLLQAGVGF